MRGYLLRLLVRPLLTTLVVVLPALLLERLLRLFDLLAPSGAMSPIIQLLLYLSPHYIGLALPAALFISVFSVIAASSEHHELDALQSIGVSLARLCRPFLWVSVLLAVGGLGLYGYLQPLGRYHYRAALDAATHAGWNAAVVPGEFIRIGRRLSVTADRVDEATGQLSGVFIEQRHPDGAVSTTTAQAGWLTSQTDAGQLVLELQDGAQVTVAPDGQVTTLQFGTSSLTRHFTIAVAVFRPRGDDEREMTLDELWTRRTTLTPPPEGTAPVPARRLVAELHGRLVRAASLAVLPLLAVPMALGAQRSRRWYGAVLSALILMFYHHAVQLAESLGDLGVMDPRIMLWGVFAAFTLFCVMTFRRAQRHPQEGPFDAFFARIEDIMGAGLARLPRRRGAAR
ncbi:LptF/LptG family permease [Roseomonas haemaphysalidis]|uniref:LptF/LptG family permease n=1 Tax=Roseomonas haemaphysalidis TaxID=2768162 RepID=A0ABS3KKR4_9PROT|nr:LptF/LptG family permease [Roseomonas haemaphysalidis]MBO1078052.1 LptF/LptG family permease [Roseomonas haemaphysalidis]